MTTESKAASEATEQPTTLPIATRRKIFVYLGALIALLTFGDPNGGLMQVPISFLLKNKLHLEAHELAIFQLVAAIPLYLSSVFGFIRDRWNPLGLKDRGFFILFGACSAILYAHFAFVPVTTATLLVAFLLLTTSFLFVDSAQNGLASVLGQQHAMTGQISALWNIFGTFPVVAALLAGGAFSDILEGENADQAARSLFLAGAAILGAVALFGLFRPSSVYDNVKAESGAARTFDDVKRLLTHWPIYPALAIWLLWNFAPGSQTPLQYFLQDKLHAEDLEWGVWNAVFSAAFVPTFLAYGFLCRRFSLKTLLLWGTLIAIPQFVPLLFVHSATGALIAAAPAGLMGGIATCAYLDLIIRACPPGLQATTLMLSSALFYVATRFGDVLGTALYDYYGGFTACVLMITIVYALIIPFIFLVPRSLILSSDAGP